MLKRVAVVAAQIFLALAVAEIGLQAAAFVVQRTTRAGMSSQWTSGNLRILCLGDSNTYGVVVPRDKPWPAQLQTVWNERVATPKIEALNLGFPGVNSSVLVRDLPRLLETFRPHVTIIMVGVNDFWTLPVPIDVREPPADSFWKRHSKLYRVYHLVERGFEKDELEIVMDPEATIEGGGVNLVRIGDQEFKMGFQKAGPGQQGSKTDLKTNLETLVQQAEVARTKLVLMSYPARHDFYKFANPIIWKTAANTGTPLINLTKVFKPLCPKKECPELLIRDHHHPNPHGYLLIAETITAQLAPLLAELQLGAAKFGSVPEPN